MWRSALGVAVMVAACAEEPPLGPPPPPTDATASCVYTGVPPRPFTSTLWRDRLGQVIRVDGWWWGESVPASFYMGYDEQGRLTRERTNAEDVQFLYEPQQIIARRKQAIDEIYTLVDGRAVLFQGAQPPGRQDRWTTTYTYDDQGRMTSYVGMGFVGDGHGTYPYTFEGRYTYDSAGRATTMQKKQDGSSTGDYLLAYTETPQQLVVDVRTPPEPGSPDQRWTYDFDAKHRIIRSTVEDYVQAGRKVVDEYVYLDGEIDVRTTGRDHVIAVRAVGACEPPRVVVAPDPPLPLQWSANYPQLPNAAAEAFADPRL